MLNADRAAFILVLLPAALWAQPASSGPLASGAFGIHAGSPATVSIAVGGYHDLSGGSNSGRAQGVFAVLEPGLHAGRVSVGFGDMFGNLGTGWTIRGTLLRTWRSEIGNYVGAEISGTVLGLGPRFGIFRQLGTSAASSTRVTADFGFGL